MRSACSKIGYTCTGMAMPRASSAGCVMSNAEPMISASGTESSWTVHSGRSPSARNDIRVRHASAPPISTTSAFPSVMSRAVRLTSDCGMFPPGCVEAVWRTGAPRRSATSAPGSAITPREQGDDPDRVDRGQDRCRTGVVGGGPSRLDDEVDGFERRLPPIGALIVLAGTDDDGRARVETGDGRHGATVGGPWWLPTIAASTSPLPA